MFQGFSQATGDFIWSLAMNNDRAWFQAHRQEFEDALNGPVRALAADTLALMRSRYPELNLQTHISRIYRDARRLFGRGPFKDRLWFTIQRDESRARGPMFWFEVDGTGWSHGMGIWEDAADIAEAFRARIDADPARFEALLRDLAAHGDFRLWGEEYKRPKGDRGPLINPWFNRRHFSVGYEHGYGGVMYTDALPGVLADDFGAMMPMFLFLSEVYNDVLIARAGR